MSEQEKKPKDGHIQDLLQNELDYTVTKKTKARKVKDIEKDAEVEPNNPQIWKELGKEYYFENNLTKALDAYRKAIAINSKDVVTLDYIGQIHVMQGEVEEGIVCFEEAIEIKPDFLEARVNLIVVYERQGKFKEAIVEINKAIKIDDKNSYFYFIRSIR
ncbi:MAG: tetratricopeptide repeat protein [Candidatus Heimdallarchaeota archaeon]